MNRPKGIYPKETPEGTEENIPKESLQAQNYLRWSTTPKTFYVNKSNSRKVRPHSKG